MAAVYINADLNYTYPNFVQNVNAGDTLFIYVSGPTQLSYWTVLSSNGFNTVSPTFSNGDGTCTAVVQSTGGTYFIEFAGEYYDPDSFGYVAVGCTITGTIAGATPPPPPPPPPPPATTYTLSFYDATFASARTNFNEGEVVYAYLTTTAADGTTLYWNTSSGSDLVSPVDGSFVVSYGFGLPSFTIASDSATEGTETLTFYIRSGSVSGTVLTSSSITINDTSTTPAPTPTYSVANASTNEGASATVNVTTTNVANGTTLYWTVSGADVSTTSGSFTISSNAGSFTIPAIADSTTEGTETYTISIRTGSTAGTVVATSTLTINDTSTTPATYAINFYDPAYNPKTTFNEGEQALVFVTTTNVPDGTTLYWNTSSGSDLVSPVDGSFVVSYGFVSVTLTISADSLTEGTESLTFYLRSGSVSGTILGSSSITINDTSVAVVTPTYSVANASTSEGATATVNVTTTNVANGTTLYWTVNAATDVATTSGSFTIISNAGSFGITAPVDSLAEGSENYTISIRTGSTSGTVVATSTLTINDTAADTTPNQFIFSNQSGVPVSSTIVSSEVQIFGINTGAPVSISGGEYSIAIDPTTYTIYTSSPGTIYNGQSIKVRHTSSASNNANTSTTLTIGGVSDTFISTTIGASGSGLYGLQIFDESGNITLDTTDNTIKDFGYFSIASVTTNGNITSVPMTTNSIALVTNNNGDGDAAIAPATVTLDPPTSSIVVSGGSSGFDISIRLMEF